MARLTNTQICPLHKCNTDPYCKKCVKITKMELSK